MSPAERKSAALGRLPAVLGVAMVQRQRGPVLSVRVSHLGPDVLSAVHRLAAPDDYEIVPPGPYDR